MFRIDKRYAKANIQKTIRFTEDIYNELDDLAKKEKIPFNTLVLQCCQYALDNLETKAENSQKE